MRKIIENKGKPVTMWSVEIHTDWSTLQASLNNKKSTMYHTSTWSDSKWYYLKYHKLDAA